MYLRRKLRWYGHIARSTGLAKTILQGMVQGGRRKGRHKKEMGRVRVSESGRLKTTEVVKET